MFARIEGSKQMPHDRFVAIVNPASGRRRAVQVLKQVNVVFEAAGARLDVQLCERPGHARQLAASIRLGNYDGCCVIGGDGTVHEVVNGLMHRNEPISLPLGVIPAGTGNTLHAQYGSNNPLAAAKAILAGQTVGLDVVRVKLDNEVIYCINIVGWGAVARINYLAEKIRLLGPMRYAVAAAAFVLRSQRRFARLTLDDQTSDDWFLFVIGCNTKLTGSGMMLAPHAEIGDDKIDVVVVRRASRWQLLKMLRKVYDGSHLSLPCVEYRQVSRFKIEHDDQFPLNLDGEALGHAPFAVEMMPAALSLFADQAR